MQDSVVRPLALALITSATLAFRQAAPAPPGHVFELQLARAGFTTPEGTQAAEVEVQIAEAGVLHLWIVPGGLDATIEVRDAAGQPLASEDGSKAAGTDFRQVRVPGAAILHVSVAASRLPAGIRAQLHVVEVRGSVESKAACRAASELLDSSASKAEGSAASEELQHAIDVLTPHAVTNPTSESRALLRRCVLAANTRENPVLARRAIELSLRGQLAALPADHDEIQTSRNALAITLETLGESREAADLLGLALASYARTRPEGHPNEVRARWALANSLARLGDEPGCVRQLRLAADLDERLHALNPGEQIRLLGALATSTKRAGDLVHARTLEEDVLERFQRLLPGDALDIQFARCNLAVTLAACGDHDAARALMEAALSNLEHTLQPGHPYLWQMRLNVAGEHLEANQPELAESAVRQVIEEMSTTREPRDPDLVWARSLLANILIMVGRPQEAEPVLREVVKAESERLAPFHPHLLEKRLSLALAVRNQGRPAEALVELEHLREDCTGCLPPDHELRLLADENRAWTLVWLGRREEAGPALSAFLRSLSASILSNALILPGREIEARAVSARRPLSAALSAATGAGYCEAPGGLASESFQAIESNRMISMLSVLLLRKVRESPKLNALREELSTAVDVVVQRAGVGDSAEAVLDAVRSRELLERRLRQELLQGDARGALLDAPSSARLAAGLASGEVLVTFWTYSHWQKGAGPGAGQQVSEDLLAFVLRPKGELERVELGPVARVKEALGRLRSAIGAGHSARSPGEGVVSAADLAAESEAARELRSLLIDPVREHAQGARSWILVPDDAVFGVPWDLVLLAGKPGELPEQVHPVLSTWERIAPPREAPVGGLFVCAGGIEYGPLSSMPAAAGADGRTGTQAGLRSAVTSRDALAGDGFTPLPASMAEVQAITELQKLVDPSRCRILSGDAVERGDLEALASRTRFLHLATHGFVATPELGAGKSTMQASVGFDAGLLGRDGTVALLSPLAICGIALSGANHPVRAGAHSPGIATGEEIATWDLSSCELAVLSACDTAAGSSRGGQGTSSLQKALHIAGARTVITSLWKVPDEATRELMVDFYRRMWVEKKPKWQALWEAKMKVRNTRDAKGRPNHPTRDWAAWILTGDPN